MARAAGQILELNGTRLYVEQSGRGEGYAVFVAGAGQGRTAWDLVVPLVTDRAHLIAFDCAGRARSGPVARGRLSIEAMADDLVALIEKVVPSDAPLVLVGHSMGGLVVRRAAERLDHRLDGLLLVDPTPETAPSFDRFDKTARRVTMTLPLGRLLFRIRPVARLATRGIRRLYPEQTYRAMLTEDFTPDGLAQTGRELTAVADAIPGLRAKPPQPPTCPVVLLSATDVQRTGEPREDLIEHQRRYVDALPHATFVAVDCDHLIPARRPEVVAEHVGRLLAEAPPPHAS